MEGDMKEGKKRAGSLPQDKHHMKGWSKKLGPKEPRQRRNKVIG